MKGIMSGSLRSHEIIYQKRFVSKIYLCTCSNIKIFVSLDNAESQYKSRLSEGGLWISVAFKRIVRETS